MRWEPPAYSFRLSDSKINILGNPGLLLGWASTNSYVFSVISNECERCNLRKVNIENAKETVIWSGSYTGFAIALDDGSSVVCTPEGFFDPNLTPGVYIVGSNGKPELIMPNNY